MNRRLLSFLLLLGIVTEVFSLLTYIDPIWRDIGWIIVTGIIIWFGWRRPAVVGYIMLGELLLGGKGYLFFTSVFGPTISIRHTIFFIATILAIRQYRRPPIDWRSMWSRFRWPTLLGAWVIMASGWGLFQGYPIGRVFLDMNAYIFLLAWPVIYLIWRGHDYRDMLFHIIAAAGIILAVKSWILVVLFGQDFAWLTTVYRWVRNTGVGEIVPINSDIMRVFMQSQVYGALALWIWLERWRTGRASMTVVWIASAASFLIIVSLSRSFWVGTAAAAIVHIALTIRRWRTYARLWPFAVSVLIALSAYSWAVNFPYPFPSQGDSAIRSAVSSRLRSTGSTDAATARQNQIGPLLSEIRHNPVIGRGFGAEARYYSTDPRVRGWRTTNAFELGWLDTWLKIGLIGIVLTIGWMIQIARSASPLARRWVIPSLVALVVIHAFTPYINHPLGLGWLLLLSWPEYD